MMTAENSVTYHPMLWSLVESGEMSVLVAHHVTNIVLSAKKFGTWRNRSNGVIEGRSSSGEDVVYSPVGAAFHDVNGIKPNPFPESIFHHLGLLPEGKEPLKEAINHVESATLWDTKMEVFKYKWDWNPFHEKIDRGETFEVVRNLLDFELLESVECYAV